MNTVRTIRIKSLVKCYYLTKQTVFFTWLLHTLWQSCVFRDATLNPSWLAKVKLLKKVRAAPLGSCLPSCWRHQQWVIHLPHRDFAHFKRLLALAQQKRLLLSEGDGTDGWQESTEDANRLWSHGAASAPLWPRATFKLWTGLSLMRARREMWVNRKVGEISKS